jgi:pimeloyl-ACP methyl ester carboxylesterase
MFGEIVPVRRRATVAIGVMIAGGAALPAVAQPARAPVPNREYVISRVADLRKINTPEGIEVLEEIEIDGSKQWISIRGLNRANPVLLMIHGGPGSPTMPISWAFQTPWEDFFTVVQWDQRGVGKNFLTADTAALAGTMTVERMVADAEAVTSHLRRRLGKEKIVVLGFSWGSMLGLHLANRRPEWIHAYVGVGQASGAGEEYLYQRLLELASAAGHRDAIRELEAIAPYPGTNPPIENVILTRKWARIFNGGWYGRPNFDLYFALPEWAPEYSEADVVAGVPAIQWAERSLKASMFADDPSSLTSLKVPVIFLMGRHDLHTPYAPAKLLFDRLEAPRKRFITFERSAHFPMFEEPGRFLLALVEEVLPLTGERVTFR